MRKNRIKRRPNILWICTDQQRFDTLGCYHNDLARTPVLDRLAKSSAVFDHAYCQSPICTPSRGSFLTGRYPVTAHVSKNGADIPETEILVTKMLHDAGYTCGLSGKLHLSACHPATGRKGIERRIADGYDEFHWSHHPADDWQDANEYQSWLRHEKNARYETNDRKDCPYVQSGMPQELHQTTWCAEKAIEFIIKHKDDDNPWLFSVNMFDPHHPFDPPQDILTSYLSFLQDIPLPSYRKQEELEKTLWHVQDHRGAYNGNAGYPFTEMSDYDHRMVKAAYWAMCELIDKQVGRILDVLDKTDQRENTIIIFMSDHGELLGDHGLYLKGPFFYECSIKVPLIMHWDSHIPIKRYEAFVSLMDIPQTLLELCDLLPSPGMQGRSFCHLFDPRQSDHHSDDIFCEYLDAMPWHTDPVAVASMVRDERYKLVVAHSAEGGELYDLYEDPGEHDNRFHDPKMQKIKILLMEKLLCHWAKTADPLNKRIAHW